MLKIKYVLTFIHLFLYCSLSYSQGQIIAAPVYKLQREDEDYKYLQDTTLYKKDFWDPLKFISLNKSKEMYLTIGGQLRPRYEFYENERWGVKADDRAGYYSQRLALNASFVINNYLRVYGELYHGNTTSKNKPLPAQDDVLDLHQAFIDIKAGDRLGGTIRIGRQEISLGTSRLVGLREGPNVRLSFDAIRLIIDKKKLLINGFYGREVKVQPHIFDNKSYNGKILWGAYISFPGVILSGTTDFYYLGFLNDKAAYHSVSGKEERQVIGFRRSGKVGREFVFNTEWIYQFGAVADKKIRAFALEFDYNYIPINGKILKSVGVKFDYMSGDGNLNDNKLKTFNPLFYNPTYFGLISAIAPLNLFDIHPTATFKIFSKASLTVDCDFFWRTNTTEGIYIPPNIPFEDSRLNDKNYIGAQPAIKIEYPISRHLTYQFETSWFKYGDFLKSSGINNNIFYLANTISYRF